MEVRNPRVCVIGAGISGLTSAKYLKEEGINFTVLEATKYVGGTWRYDSRVGTDENDLPLFSSMYEHLRTNLPKPAMELRGFPLPNNWPSFPSWQLMYDYIKAYTKHYDLKNHIKLLHLVVSVRRVGNVWKVMHKHVVTTQQFEEDYDFVIIGNGHYSKPKYPKIPGEDHFKGKIIHSHDYKNPEPFKHRRVLVIGAGPSGMDIGIDVAEVSNRLILSHHLENPFQAKYPPHHVIKPDVKELNETGAIFVDGTYEDIDDIIFCTGYEYHNPFLDVTSGLNLDARSVTPLYKYIVNINQPSMVFLGLVVRSCLFVAIDAQARYVTALIKGNFKLPSKEEMMEEWQKRVDAITAKGRPISDIHFLGPDEEHYYAALTEQSGIDRVPAVMYKIRMRDAEAKMSNWYTYRNYEYWIIDNETFTRCENIKYLGVDFEVNAHPNCV